jgi:hypothetical protein
MRGALILSVALFCALGCVTRWPWQRDTTEAKAVDLNLAWLKLEGLSAENAIFFAEFYKKCLWASTAKYYNLGNAQFLAGQLPEALLAYRRGLRLNPNDAGLAENLDYARNRVQYPFGQRGRPEEDCWPAWLHKPAAFQVLVAALILYGLAWVLATRWYMTRRPALWKRAGLAFVLAAAGGGYWLYLENENNSQDQHPLVVIRQDKLPLRKGNGPSYPVNPDLPFLSRGMEARRLHERGGWLQIQFASGEIGWVEKAAVLGEEGEW